MVAERDNFLSATILPLQVVQFGNLAFVTGQLSMSFGDHPGPQGESSADLCDKTGWLWFFKSGYFVLSLKLIGMRAFLDPDSAPFRADLGWRTGMEDEFRRATLQTAPQVQ